MVRRTLEGVLPGHGEDGIVSDDEVCHPGDGGDDERLAGGVEVRLGPRQHPHARQLKQVVTDYQ